MEPPHRQRRPARGCAPAHAAPHLRGIATTAQAPCSAARNTGDTPPQTAANSAAASAGASAAMPPKSPGLPKAGGTPRLTVAPYSEEILAAHHLAAIDSVRAKAYTMPDGGMPAAWAALDPLPPNTKPPPGERNADARRQLWRVGVRAWALLCQCHTRVASALCRLTAATHETLHAATVSPTQRVACFSGRC